MIDTQAKNSFWSVVEDCLVEFHGFSQCDAHSRSEKLRKELENPQTGIVRGDLVYHDEPFEIARRIAQSDLDLSSQNRGQYEGILRRHRL
jgi:hypothetical protein